MAELKINGQRLWASLMEMARIGATPKGGVCRLTLTETLQAWQAAQALGYAGIVSARSGETEDTTIVHLAIAWQTGQLKVGSFARGERMAKWNEALRIEQCLGASARFAGMGTFGRNPGPRIQTVAGRPARQR